MTVISPPLPFVPVPVVILTSPPFSAPDPVMIIISPPSPATFEAPVAL